MNVPNANEKSVTVLRSIGLVSWLMCKLGMHRPVKGTETLDGYYQRGRCRVCRCEIYRDMHWEQGDGVWRKPANEKGQR
jgi:hypothetical protein